MLKTILKEVPDPRGFQGRDYELWSILALVIVSFLCGRKGLAAACRLGKTLTKEQRRALGFWWKTPCHSTFTTTLAEIDADALAAALGQAVIADGSEVRQLCLDGKTMRASKDGEGKQIHVVSAFCDTNSTSITN